MADDPLRRVVVVTGAAAGIGRATVELFAERGHDVVAVDPDAAGLSVLGPAVVTLAGDAADEAVNAEAVRLAVERFGRLDAAVLNAGVGGAPPLERDGAVAGLDRAYAVNVRGLALGIRAALPALRASGGGSIVVTTSVAGLRGDPYTWAYSATKAAAINLVRCAAIDHAHEGIRVNALAPGLTDTPRTADVLADPARADPLVRRIPLGRPATAREQAQVIWFLAGPESSYVTGAVVPCDGGLSAATGLLLPPAGSPDRP